MVPAETKPVAPELDPEALKMKKALDRVLRGTMGVPFPGAGQVAPLTSAVVWLLAYIAVWVILDVFVNRGVGRDPRLDSLLVWGGLYCAAALYLAQSATVWIKDTVIRDIVAHASAGYVDKVATSLQRHYRFGKMLGISLVISLIALAGAGWTLWADKIILQTFSPPPIPAELVFWTVTYGIHFGCAALAVIAAGFYSCFAKELEMESGRLYVLGAAETPIIRGLERLSMEVLTFWGVIFLLVLSSLLLAIVPPKPYRLDRDSTFLFALIPFAGFFSLGVGTLIHLRTDAKIRAVLHRFTRRHAAALQEEIDLAVKPAGKRVPKVKADVEMLTARHDRIIAGGRYGSRTGTSVSIALPLILPVVGVLVEIFG